MNLEEGKVKEVMAEYDVDGGEPVDWMLLLSLNVTRTCP